VEYGEILARFGIPREAGEKLLKSSKVASNYAYLLEAVAIRSPEDQKKAQAAAVLLEKAMANPDIQSGKSVLAIDWNLVAPLELDGRSNDARNALKVKSDLSGKAIEAIVANTSAFRGSVSESILKMFGGADTPEQQRAKVSEFIRSDLKQYDVASSDIIERKWSQVIGKIPEEYFMKLVTEIQSKGPNVSASEYQAIESKIGKPGMEKVLAAIAKASAQASEDWEKNSKKHVEKFKAQSGYTGDISTEQLAKIRETYRSMSISAVAKKEIMYQYLSKDAGLLGGKSTDPELKTLEGILGVGTLRMSDRSMDITGEVASFLAIEAAAVVLGMATAGAATWAINSAVIARHTAKGVKYAEKGVKYAEAYNALNGTGKALVWTARSVGGMGVGFEVGAGGARSLIEGKNMYTAEGFAQSIAMGVVMHGLGSFFDSVHAPTFLKFG
jgi:hypothetical protein